MVIFLKLPIRAEVPGRSELSSRQDGAVHHHPFPSASFFGIFPGCLPLQAGVGKTYLTFSARLVWQSRGPWGGWAVIQGFRFPFHHHRVSLSPYHCWPLFCREGGGASEGAACRKACESGQRFLIPILWVGSEFPSLNLRIPREQQCGESTPHWSFPHGLWSRVGNGLWCDEFKHLASYVSLLPGIRMLLRNLSNLFTFCLQ